MSQRPLYTAFAPVALALSIAGAVLAEDRTAVPGDVRLILDPIPKPEEARRKPRKSASDDLKTRLFASAPAFPGHPAPAAKMGGKHWPPVLVPPEDDTGPRAADGAGGGIADTPCGQCPVKEIGCGVPGSGVLNAGDCQLDDGSFVDVWRLELAEPREVTIELASTDFDTYLFLLDSACETVLTNDDCGLDNFDLSCISFPLAAGTYFIAVNSFSAGEAGAYTLDAACAEITSCVDCLSDQIGCNEGLAGELFDDDCVGPDGAFYDIYGFELVAASRIHARLESESFDTYLELLDGGCLPVAGNDDCAPQNLSRSCVVVDLDPGKYHLRLSSAEEGAIGPYDVTLECFPDFDLCDDCVVAPITCGESISGTFPAGRCVRLGGENLDLYPLELATPGPVVVNLRSEAFDTFLRLFDANCEEIALNDDCEPQNLDLSCLEVTDLEAGRYFVGVSSFTPGGRGEFSLEVRCPDFTACRECVRGNISCGEPVSGVLETGTCALEGGRSFDLWRLDLFGQDAIDLAFSVSAQGFEPAFALLGSTCEVICEGVTPDVCHQLRQVDPGTYYLRVSGNELGAAGAYDLRVDCSLWGPCLSCLSEPIACGQPRAGTLDDEDCRLPDGTFFDAWPFSLDRAQAVTITLESGDFDTFLFLRDAACFPIASNDDCAAGSTNSCITIELAAGDYFVVANSFTRAMGGYDLSIQCADIRTCADCRLGSLTCGEPVAAVLPTSLCQLVADGSWIDYYEIVLPADGTLDLQLTSTEFDTFLFLLDEGCGPIATNDDCVPGNFDVSCLSLDLPQGTYYAAVNSLAAGETGAYELIATCSGGAAPEGIVLPGDCNGDASLNLADGLCLLGDLFAGQPSPVTCGGIPYAQLALSDFDGQGGTTISDAVGVFSYLFAAGPPHVLGTECVPVNGCESRCEP